MTTGITSAVAVVYSVAALVLAEEAEASVVSEAAPLEVGVPEAAGKSVNRLIRKLDIEAVSKANCHSRPRSGIS